MKKKNNRRLLPAILGAAALVVVLLLSAVFTMELRIELTGEQELILEFGQQIPEDLTAKAVVKSWLFGSREVELQVTGDDKSQPQKLGSHTVTYSASYLWLKSETSRTIRVVDTTAPQIVLMYSEGSYTLPGQTYVEEGFAAEDNYDGDITERVKRVVVNDTVYYTVEDSSGNTVTVERPIRYGDFEAPVLTLLGEQTITIKVGQKFTDPGFTAVDNAEGDVSTKVTVSNDHNTNKAGTYTITYTVTDNYGNTATAQRTLVVKAADQPQVVVPEGAVIYLTFDDGPSQHTLRLLEVLDKYDVKATFFVVGKAGIGYLDEIVNAGHSIAIHTTTHEYSEIYASEDAFIKDLTTMSDIIYERTGVRTTLMRFPGGSSNAISKNYNVGIMTRLTKLVEEMGYQYFDWNVDSKDAGGAKTADEVYQNVINGCNGRKTSIVLQHDIHGYSVDAVERIIQWGLANGYKFLPLDETSPTAHHGVNN